MQQNYKNAALNRIDEGTKICAESGVCILDLFVLFV